MSGLTTSTLPQVPEPSSALPAQPRALSASDRIAVQGKFLFASGRKFHIKGVTYGPFRPEADGCEYHTPEQVRNDFAQIAATGINCVRVYTVPPRWLLDAAAENGLRVMLGLPWEQHITFLDSRKRIREILKRFRAGVRECAGHPALLAFAIGNEIPAPIVRWHGHKKTERFLRRLYEIVKSEDPSALVTYVNFPSTEYLNLPFVDFVCFNVYLERRERLEAYLARLQNIAGDKPLVMAEIGLDSLRNGDELQGKTLEWQIQAVFGSGCAGVFVFSWTDEWFRGGHDILDWKFGMTTIERQPKPALDVVKRAFADVPFPMDRAWPKVSVIVCTHNGSATIRQTLDGLRALEYPNFEAIIVDDGSSDDTATIVKEYPFRLISTAANGLSAARNTGLEAATGEIVAFLDDDAWPDPHWLMYLADAFMGSTHAAVGGPNIAPPGNGLVAEAVAHSPGGPTHVLIDDRLAEHIPGCNMAYKAEALRAIGGFDPQFRIAGDDVDICWRIIDNGGTIGFTAGAMVWHHRRRKVSRFWKQQFNYGKAEGQLERKWPQRYSASGRVTWAGRMYDKGIAWAFTISRRRIYHGTWGSALFQSVYQPAASFWAALGLMPEWFLLIFALGAMSIGGIFWRPLLATLPLFVLALGVPVVQSVLAAARADFAESRGAGRSLFKLRALTAWLHFTQPLVRLLGRMSEGLAPWRRRGRGFSLPTPTTLSNWSETWVSPESRLETLERNVRALGGVVIRGGDYDPWDLEVRAGATGGTRVTMTIEEHGSGKQMAKYAVRPGTSLFAKLAALLLLVALGIAALSRHWVACAVFGAVTVLLLIVMIRDCGSAKATVRKALSVGERK